MFKDYQSKKRKELFKRDYNFLQAFIVTLLIMIAGYFILGCLMDLWFIKTCGYYNDCYAINQLK